MSLCLNCEGRLERPSSLLPSYILETNEPPTESQIPSIRDFISRARSHKSLLDSKIAQVQSLLQELLSERDEVDNEIRKHEGALSPLRRMPPEILSLIFTSTFSRTLFSEQSAPWIASAVCSRWRLIALSPTFWTTISDQDHHFNLFNLNAQLARSGDLPLTITFTCEVQSITADYESKVADLLAAHSARWETISLDGPEVFFSRIQRTLPQFPMLRKLEVEIQSTEPPASSTLSIFSHAPRLAEASINVSSWPFPVAMVLPWHQLSRYRATVEWGGLADLASASALVECMLDLGADQEPANLNLGTILLPRLLRLSISHRRILAYLETPVLGELYDHDRDNFASLSGAASLPRTLTTLVLVRNMDLVDQVDLLSIVGAIPALKSFGFTRLMPWRLVLNFLCSISTRAPALEHLSLAVKGDLPLELIDAMQAMEWGTWRLRSLRFWTTAVANEQLDRLIATLRGHGVDVETVDFRHELYGGMVPETLWMASH
ncbi:hypothetical protein FB45DRAFT_921869 [Roridomyces roridus]|uniref:F-box domain-containing protein n=1 Tax=Roridomyces roridus TaxID=1738132 RepID=A0AAD7FLC0_9AGAR|nr:hypothetical protein FB45DRAFT_921869 [Roridomyces roridus]